PGSASPSPSRLGRPSTARPRRPIRVRRGRHPRPRGSGRSGGVRGWPPPAARARARDTAGTPPGSFRACGTALPRTSAWPMRASSWRCVYHRRSLHCEEAMIHDSILGTIGNTPIVRINRLAPRHTTIYVKCEAFNPMSSVKDRLAIAMIEDAERRGTLKPGQTVIEPTSGNTGIALAMVCAAKGYPFVAVMSDSFSVERHKIQGWNPDFVPAVFNKEIYDESVLVGEVEARDAARALAQKEGIFCGISSGATFAAAVKVAAKAKEGSVLLAMLPDTGERYLTTFLFEGITEASDEV